MLGGPMYALERGLKQKWLGILFCIFTAMAAFGIGSTVQANSIALLMQETYGVSEHITGIVVALGIALVIFFGVKGIARVCMTLVPLMAILYIGDVLYPHSEPRLFGRSLQTHHQFCVYSTCRRRRISRNECHARSTLRYCPRTILQRIRTWFGTYCGSSGTNSQPGTSGTGFLLPEHSGDTVIICALTGLVLVTVYSHFLTSIIHKVEH